jgi:hypothetical protein
MCRSALFVFAVFAFVGCAKPQLEAEPATREQTHDQPATHIEPPDRIIETTVERHDDELRVALKNEDVSIEDNGLPPAFPDLPPGVVIDVDPIGFGPPSPPPVSRVGKLREQLLQQHGGTKETEDAVALGLRWLALKQQRDGSWVFDGTEKNDVASATGYALLAFLGSGEVHKGGQGKYKATVQRGLEFLLRSQQRDGQFKCANSLAGNAIATLAIAEAYTLTGDPMLKRFVLLGCKYLESQQNILKDSGWSATPNEASELAVTLWAMQALRAATDAKQLGVKDNAVKHASKFLDSVANGDKKSQFGSTTNKNAAPGTTLTATGLLARYYTGEWNPKHDSMIDGVSGLLKNPPSEKNADPLYLFQATRAVYFGGSPDDWETWNAGTKDNTGTRKNGFRDLLTKSQEKESLGDRGRWNAPDSDFGKRYGALGTTALNTLTLEVYYRELPRKPEPKPELPPALPDLDP